MNIRQAILKAADHIEANPMQFDFDSCAVPSSPGCGTPGCAIGWIAYFLGVEFREAVVLMVAKDNTAIFYDRIRPLAGGGWLDDARLCVRGLRLYADKYHPAEQPKGIPASVLAIFETKQEPVDVRA